MVVRCRVQYSIIIIRLNTNGSLSKETNFYFMSNEAVIIKEQWYQCWILVLVFTDFSVLYCIVLYCTTLRNHLLEMASPVPFGERASCMWLLYCTHLVLHFAWNFVAFGSPWKTAIKFSSSVQNYKSYRSQSRLTYMMMLIRPKSYHVPFLNIVLYYTQRIVVQYFVYGIIQYNTVVGNH